MLAISRWQLILVVTVVLTISLFQVAHYSSYDTDVLRYVTNKVKEGSKLAIATSTNDQFEGPTRAAPAPTVTKTVFVDRPAETIIVEKPAEESDEPEQCREKEAVSVRPFQLMNSSISVPTNITYDPKGPKPSQIVLLTATDGKGHNEAIPNVVERARANRDEYCKHQGYIHNFIDITKYDLPDVHPVWKKLPAIVETFNKYPDAQWVFWLDLDAIIMTPSLDLQSLILSREGQRKSFHLGAELIVGPDYEHSGDVWPREPDFDNVDLIVAQDHASVNAGSFLLRRSVFTQMLLDIWADPLFMYADFGNKEQDAMLHLLKHHPTVRQHTGIARQRAINAFMEGADWMQFQKGDLLVHFAGCWVPDKCEERWEKWWDLRERAVDA